MVKSLSLDQLAVYYTIPSREKINSNHTYVGMGKSMYFSVRENSYNEISDHIFLGKLPYAGLLLPPEVKMVVSMSTYEELANSVTPAQWRERSIEQVFLHIPDYTADVITADALAVIHQVHHFVVNRPDDAVYFHCQLGHSRSVMMCSAYLSIYGDNATVFENFEKAFAFVRSKRSYASMNEGQLKKAQEIIQSYSPLVSVNDDLIQLEASDYIGTIEAKNALRQLTYFKELAVYATQLRSASKNESAVTLVQQFFNEMLYAENGKWYEDLCAQRGPLQALLKLENMPQDELTQWTKLIEDFKNEVKEHLAKYTVLPEDDYAEVFTRLYAR